MNARPTYAPSGRANLHDLWPYAVSLLDGIWKGDAWWAHRGDMGALAVVFAVCTALSAKVFRWE